MKKYPEHEKLKAVQSQSQACGAFYEWLQSEKGIEMEVHYDYERDDYDEKVWRDRDGNIVEDYADPSVACALAEATRVRMTKLRDKLGVDCRLVAKPGGPITLPVRQTISSLLAEFFEIDEDKLEKEKCAMLAECRAAHEKPRG